MQVKSKVVMLPTNEAWKTKHEVCLWLSTIKRELNYCFAGFAEHEIEGVEKQHLYFTTEEEIKQDDWCIVWSTLDNFKPIVMQNKHGVLGSVIGSAEYLKENCRKIVATTDPKCTVQVGIMDHDEPAMYPLPSPTNEFLKKYAVMGGISEVMIEYINKGRPKIAYGENTITIRGVKNNWNREEVVQLLERLAIDLVGHSIQKSMLEKMIEEWKSKNL